MRGQAKVGLLIIIVLVVAAIGYGVSTYNQLVALHEQIPEAWSQVDNTLQRRNDLIPNYVNTVKGFAKQEQQIYGDISKALQSFSRAQTVPEKIQADNAITGLLSRLTAISVNYPELRSNENFQRLQDELAGTENRIAVARKRFNETVLAYNMRVKTLPSSVVARLGHFAPSENYFQAAEGARTVPQVQF
jgi:LemA protein